VGIPQHIIQRGNNRQVCFFYEPDYIAYAAWLRDYSLKFEVDIHAWVFMTNHVHLLATPRKQGAISKMTQSLGRMYVSYFNKTYSRTGTLWEGRYKSCLVDQDWYLFACYRYIELNPVTARMVSDPAEYFWSSYQANALGRASSLLTPHQQYLSLGKYDQDRQEAYRGLFRSHLNAEMVSDIRDAVNKGLVLGSGRFKDQIEENFNRRTRVLPRGRPKKLS
jgi:putative transposase